MSEKDPNDLGGLDAGQDDDSLFAELDSEVLLSEGGDAEDDLDLDFDLGDDSGAGAAGGLDLDLDFSTESELIDFSAESPSDGGPDLEVMPEAEDDLGSDGFEAVPDASSGDLDLDVGLADDLDLEVGDVSDLGSDGFEAVPDASSGDLDLDVGLVDADPDDAGGERDSDLEVDLNLEAMPEAGDDLDLGLDADAGQALDTEDADELDLDLVGSGIAEDADELDLDLVGSGVDDFDAISEDETVTAPQSTEEQTGQEQVLDAPPELMTTEIDPDANLVDGASLVDLGIGVKNAGQVPGGQKTGQTTSASLEELVPESEMLDLPEFAAEDASPTSVESGDRGLVMEPAEPADTQPDLSGGVSELEVNADEMLELDEEWELEPLESPEPLEPLRPLEPLEPLEDFETEDIGTAIEPEGGPGFTAVQDRPVDDEALMELNLNDVDAPQVAELDAAATTDFDVTDTPTMVPSPVDPMVPSPVDPVATAAPALSDEILLSVSHQISVELGGVTLNGRELMGLSYGSVIPLERMLGEPVDLMLENRAIAQAEVVLINGKNLGVRIVSLNPKY